MQSLYKNTFRLIILLSGLIVIYPFKIGYMDASHPWQVGFQDPASPIMEGIIFFNGLLMTFMLSIACFVGWLLYQSLKLFNETTHTEPVSFNHSTLLEVVWTIIPAGILMIISVPSYNLLYAMEEVIDPSLTIKVVGHQWYWSYECSDFDVVPYAAAPTAAAPTNDSVNIYYKDLKSLVTAIEISRREAALGEVQTQIALVKKHLDFIGNSLEDLSPEKRKKVAKPIARLAFDLLIKEHQKDSYEYLENLSTGETLSILADAKKDLVDAGFTQEKQDLVLEIFKRFKQLLRIIDGNKLESAPKAILDALEDIKTGKDISAAEVIKKFLALSMAGEEDQVNPDGSIGKGKEWELSRAQKDAFRAEAEWDRARIDSDFAKSDLKVAKYDLDNAKNCSKWAEIDLEAAKINKLTADYIKAAADSAVTSPSLIRGRLLMEEGFEGWTPEFRVKTKEIADKATALLIKASEKYVSATDVSDRAAADLTPEELNKFNAIATSADAEFTVVEELDISVEFELEKAKEIWKNAEAELRVFNAISERAETRLKKAQIVFDEAKITLDRTHAEFKGAEVVFEEAKATLAGTTTNPKPVNLVCSEDTLNTAKNKYNSAQKDFVQATARLNENLAELNRAEERLDTVKVYVDETKTILNNTPIIHEYKASPEEPVSYFDNFLWEIHNDDVLTVEAQLISAKEELVAAEMAVKKTKLKLSNIGENLVETDLEKAKIEVGLAKQVYEKAKLDLKKTEALYQSKKANRADLDNSELNLLTAKTAVGKAEKYLNDMELGIAEAIYEKAKTYLTESNSDSAKLLYEKAKEGLSAVKLKNMRIDSNLLEEGINDSNKEWGIAYKINSLDHTELHSDYADVCLNKIKIELGNAEADFLKTADIYTNTKNILDKIYRDLSTAPIIIDRVKLSKLWSLYDLARVNLNETFEHFENTRSNLYPLDIKLKPSLIESKAYTEVLHAEAELANAEWLSIKVSKLINEFMPKVTKPSEILFSDSSAAESNDSSLNSNDSSLSGGAEGDDSNKKDDDSNKKDDTCNNPLKRKKSHREIKAILADIEAKKKITYTKGGLCDEITRLFYLLRYELDKDELRKLHRLMAYYFDLLHEEEVAKNKELTKDVDEVLNIITEPDKDDDESEHRINFDSYLIADDDLVITEAFGTAKAGKVFRLLEVDNRLVVPVNTHIRLLVTSADVLHSWAVPSLGIKVDACPGRLNQVFLFVKREGVFYGQCSELCGVNHGFMPIVVQAVNQDDYLAWVEKRLCS